MWNDFSKTKPTKDGWYSCTVEIKGFQRYVMDLYWNSKQQAFKDNRVINVFQTYRVMSVTGERLHKDNVCDRTDGVVAWMELPNPCMDGFVNTVEQRLAELSV